VWEAGVNGGTNYVNFPERTITSYYDVDGWNAGMFFRYRSTPVLRWLIEATISRTALVIPAEGDFPGDFQIEYERGLNFGVEYDTAPGNNLRFVIGLPYYEYQSDSPTQFRTVVGQFEYNRRIPAWYQLNVQLLRNSYPTTFFDNNYYVDERFILLLTNDRESRFELGGRVTYYWNRYAAATPEVPFGGEKRVDKTIEGEAFVGYRLGGGMTWRVFFRGETRVSTINQFEYGVGTIGTSFVLGE
jgi:hypothetical protein